MGEPLFTHFLVVRVASKEEDDDTGFGLSTKFCLCAPGHSRATVPLNIVRLCFPDLNGASHNNRMVSQQFKATCGADYIAFFRRHLLTSLKKQQNPTRSDQQPLECLCLITRYDLHEIFDSVMQQIQFRWLLSPNSVPPFLNALLKQEVPNTCGHIALALRGTGDAAHQKQENFLFHRPSFDHMAVSAQVLFEYLTVDNVMTLISSLLCEQRVIVTSSSISTISQCIFAAKSLLYPFKWLYEFVSVLPSYMLHHAFSPAPFLLGILANDMKFISRMHLHPTLVVKLDTNELETVGGPVDAVALPGVASAKLRSRLGQIAPQGMLSDRLKKGLNTIFGKSVDMDQILCSDAIYVSTMGFFVITFGNWRRCITNSAAGTPHFDLIKFLEAARNAPEDDFVFFGTFCRTKMFHAFAQELASHSQSTLTGETSAFCKLCSITARRDNQQDASVGFHSVLDALKPEMYPPRIGRIASVALELTSSTPSSMDRTHVLSSLAQATFSSLGLKELFGVVSYRLAGCQGRSWRHAAFAFDLLQVMISHGSDAVITILRDSISQYLPFLQYSHKEDEVQITIRNQAENLVKQILDLTEQANNRIKNYCILAESLSPYRTRSTRAPLVHPANVETPNIAQVAEKLGISMSPPHHGRLYSEEFHSSVRRRTIEDGNEKWVKYRIKSLVKGRARVFPKFLKLHKMMGEQYASGLSSNCVHSVFEDLLQMNSPGKLFEGSGNLSISEWGVPTQLPPQPPLNTDEFFLDLTAGTLSDRKISESSSNHANQVDPFAGLFS
uniref:UDENN domain-containing protein n=1 Tax=Spongospora subterranea TaxID=70186 RepID=A0A0H5RBC2_9EUKA|eukprot:CRZ11106.1 hypothetical protein [Spongospora subterranea]